MAKYTLPELPYDFAALEPHLSAKILEVHHGKHHKAYVDGANKQLELLADAREKKDFSKIALLERALAFNVSGHLLHCLYWQNLSPKGGGEPTGTLAAAIQKDFGSFENFKSHLTEASMTTMGSGWGVLAWEPALRRLMVIQLHDHESLAAVGMVPLMALDAWEHAFYLQYGPAKADYFKAIWNVWNWADIQARFDKAQSVDLGLKSAAA
ncbi:MAG: superoxide dismutase [Deltaproteobacteria bacterium]|nr:superoxide dismutase [Deltaproteobacteria bacterium]